MFNDLLLIRILFVLIVASAAYLLEPFGLPAPWAGGTGLLLVTLLRQLR